MGHGSRKGRAFLGANMQRHLDKGWSEPETRHRRSQMNVLRGDSGHIIKTSRRRAAETAAEARPL
eukprot:2914250-Pyramimonas_sp.AAC.1